MWKHNTHHGWLYNDPGAGGHFYAWHVTLFPDQLATQQVDSLST